MVKINKTAEELRADQSKVGEYMMFNRGMTIKEISDSSGVEPKIVRRAVKVMLASGFAGKDGKTFHLIPG